MASVLDDVHVLAAAVVALAGIALGVLVGEDAARGFEHGLGSEILAGDQLEARVLPQQLLPDGVVYSRIDLGKGP